MPKIKIKKESIHKVVIYAELGRHVTAEEHRRVTYALARRSFYGPAGYRQVAREYERFLGLNVWLLYRLMVGDNVVKK